MNDSHRRAQTIKGSKESDDAANTTLKVPGAAYASGHSVGRGDLDQAIRSMRDGRRRARPDRRPLSKMFVDGSNRQSRIYE